MTRIMRKTSNGFEEIFNSSTIADLTSRIETLESNWNSVSYLFTTIPIAGLRLLRCGNIVIASIDIKMTYSSGQNTVLSDIPYGYRPAYAIYADVGCGGGGPTLRFNASGTVIKAYNYSATGKNNVSGSFVYSTVDKFPE